MKPQLIAKCPKCGWTQYTQAKKIVKCIKCEKSFTLYPKGKKARLTSTRIPDEYFIEKFKLEFQAKRKWHKRK